MDEFDCASGRMAGDFRTVITEGEDLPKVAAPESGEAFTNARTKSRGEFRSATARLADTSQPVFDRTREAAAVADDYAAIHEPPPVWRVELEC